MTIARYILTGAPGAGKTTLIQALAAKGHLTVPEAATDLIAERQALGTVEPWLAPDFIAEVTTLQRHRRLAATSPSSGPQFHDRSPFCTLALTRFLNQPVPSILKNEIVELREQQVFAREVFLIHNLGFVTPTAARRISLAEARRFEVLHIEVYLEFGYRLIEIRRGRIGERCAAISAFLR